MARQQLAHGNSSRSGGCGGCGGGGGGSGGGNISPQLCTKVERYPNRNPVPNQYKKHIRQPPNCVVCATTQRLIAMNADLKITKHYTEPVHFISFLS
jgi:hypothetical protein